MVGRDGQRTIELGLVGPVCSVNDARGRRRRRKSISNQAKQRENPEPGNELMASGRWVQERDQPSMSAERDLKVDQLDCQPSSTSTNRGLLTFRVLERGEESGLDRV